LETWQVVALIGAVIFLFAGFLPLISASAMFVTISFSLVDMYRFITSPQPGTPTPPEMTISIPTGAYMLILALILYPITIILGFLSIIKQKLSLIAGILGIICWIGGIWFVYDLNTLSLGVLNYGIGIFVGFVGAIILLAAFFVKRREVAPLSTATVTS